MKEETAHNAKDFIRSNKEVIETGVRNIVQMKIASAGIENFQNNPEPFLREAVEVARKSLLASDALNFLLPKVIIKTQLIKNENNEWRVVLVCDWPQTLQDFTPVCNKAQV